MLKQKKILKLTFEKCDDFSVQILLLFLLLLLLLFLFLCLFLYLTI